MFSNYTSTKILSHVCRWCHHHFKRIPLGETAVIQPCLQLHPYDLMMHPACIEPTELWSIWRSIRAWWHLGEHCSSLSSVTVGTSRETGGGSCSVHPRFCFLGWWISLWFLANNGLSLNDDLMRAWVCSRPSSIERFAAEISVWRKTGSLDCN